MQIFNEDLNGKYNNYINSLKNRNRWIFDKGIPLAMFSFAGALGWAIRGTYGWGGMSGGMVAGFIWVSVFILLAAIRGIDARKQFIALGLGIAFGGFSGYGQFLSWIRGVFMVGDPASVSNPVLGESTLPISPLVGYTWLMIVGLEWGGTAGGFLAWSLKPSRDYKIWLLRLGIPLITGLIGFYLIKLNPGIFFPNYSQELYQSEQCSIHCSRTASTLPMTSFLLGITIGIAIVEAILRNKLGLKVIGIMAVSFGLIFPAASPLMFCYEQCADIPYGSWWKFWEMSIGFVGGLGIGIAFLILMKNAESDYYIKNRITWNQIRAEYNGRIKDDETSGNPVNNDNDHDRPATIDEIREWRSFLSILYIYIMDVIIGSSNSWLRILSLGVYMPKMEYEITIPRLIFIILPGLLIGYKFFKFHGRIKNNIQSGNDKAFFPPGYKFQKFYYAITFSAISGMAGVYPDISVILYAIYSAIVIHLALRLERVESNIKDRDPQSN